MSYVTNTGLGYFFTKISALFAGKSAAISNITRSGTTFTATKADGTTFTFDQQDTDTTYSNATTSAAGLMSAADKTIVDGISTTYATKTEVDNTYAKKTDITGIYKYKGTVATESLLPSTGQNDGDVYNIEAASTYGAAGMNVAWNGTSSAWDALGEKFTITDITNAEIDTIVSGS